MSPRHWAVLVAVATGIAVCWHLRPFPAGLGLGGYASTATAFIDSDSGLINVTHVVDATSPSSVAWARYVPSYKQIGWYQLEISASRNLSISNVTKARAVGILEAYFQTPQIYNYWTNYRLNEYKKSGGHPSRALEAYVHEQSQWVKGQISANKETDKFWATMELVVEQFEGLVEGYWRYTEADKNLTWTELYLLNSVGDLYDLNVKYHDDPTANGYQPTPGHGMVGPGGYGDMLECSALIKVYTTGCGHRTFLAAHTTWRPYYAMVRTFKVYDVPWASTGPLQIASSPGLLHSKDDWYTTDRLLIMETTNGVYNASLYDNIGPASALTWQRVQVANFAAASAKEWIELFSTANSGTYNNQWMVLDSLALTTRSATDALWILEQIPGYTKAADVTQVVLDQGFWSSYNVPYFQEIYNASGYPHPSIYSTCPRARIFQREAPRVRSTFGMQRLIRQNMYLSDPLSQGVPNNAIAARYDMPAAPEASSPLASNWTRRPYGAVDAKLTATHFMAARRQLVVAGPTTADGSLPPFDWNDPQFAGVPHEGSVERFDFPWVDLGVKGVGPMQWGGATSRCMGRRGGWWHAWKEQLREVLH